MATATIAPTVITAEHSRIHTAWQWMRELMRKARKGFTSGVYKVRVTITQALQTTAAHAVAAGAQIGLATRAGWNGASAVATSALGMVAKGVVQVARGASWVADKIGKAFGWFAGLFSKKAGAAISKGNAEFTQWRQQKLGAAFGVVDNAVFVTRAAVTSKSASTVGRTVSGVIGAAGVINLVTKGALAAKVASYIGPKAAWLFGPMGLVVTAAVGVLGGLFACAFRRNEVTERAFELIAGEAVATEVADNVAQFPKQQETVSVDPVTGEAVVDLTAEGGAEVEGDEAAVQALQDNEMAAADAQAAAKLEQLRAAGMPLKPDPKAVTNEVIEESLRQDKATPQANGKYSKSAMDKRRTALRSGDHPMPTMPENAEAISA